jgi:HSP20 family molecular chaperone IbpA
MESMFRGFGCCDEDGAEPGSFHFDFACKPFRPPMKRYRDKAGNLVFEFILPGFDMADIDLGFAGDRHVPLRKKPRAKEPETLLRADSR